MLTFCNGTSFGVIFVYGKEFPMLFIQCLGYMKNYIWFDFAASYYIFSSSKGFWHFQTEAKGKYLNWLVQLFIERGNSIYIQRI